MDYYFSESTLSFYPSDLEKTYTSFGNWPDDLKIVSETVYKEFAEKPNPVGKRRGSIAGNPAWVDDVTDETTLVSIEKKWIEDELSRARNELEKVQDSDSKAIGTVAQWREYRKELRVWEENDNFPNAAYRPKSPDYKE